MSVIVSRDPVARLPAGYQEALWAGTLLYYITVFPVVSLWLAEALFIARLVIGSARSRFGYTYWYQHYFFTKQSIIVHPFNATHYHIGAGVCGMRHVGTSFHPALQR